jgi:hypothetical protein
MSLTDIMSGSRQELWQSIALLLFAIAFVAIVVRVLLRPRAEIARQAHLPLEDER